MRPATDQQSLLLTAIVLTFNEERHIARCLASLRGVCDDVLVVDSGSTDRTVEIARSLGAHVETNPWVNHAVQINWGIKHLVGRPALHFALELRLSRFQSIIQ